MNFRDLVGHEDIIKHFKSSIEMDKVSHAYVISGEVGSGKKALAKAFSKTLQCEEGKVDPCEKCQSCKQAESGNHPDIIFVTHEKSVISVNDIRQQVINTIDIKPYKSRYKIYIIEESELMTVEAQNALLKTIEEPPEYGVLILLTSNIEKLLPTVISRSIVLNIKPVRERDILDYLTKEMGLTLDKAYFCLDFAQGNLGKAIKLAGNDEYVHIVESVVNVLTHIPDMDVEDLAKSVSDIERFKLSMDDYMDLMMMWYRDVLMLKVTGNIDKLLFKDQYSTLKKQAGVLSYSAIDDKINAIETAKTRIDVNANFDVTMELLLLTLKEK